MKKMRVAVLGAGGYGAEVVELAQLLGHRVTAFFDDRTSLLGTELMGVKCIGPIQEFKPADFDAYFIGIGNNGVRMALAARFARQSGCSLTLVHPSAVISRTAQIEEGTYVGAQTYVGPNARLGKFVLVNTNCSIAHDSILDDGVQVCPGASISGGAQLEAGVFIGSSATVAPSKKVGAWARVSAGSFVLHSVDANCLVSGVPAIVLRHSDKKLIV